MRRIFGNIKKKQYLCSVKEEVIVQILDSNYLFSLLTGILFMTQLAWTTVFLLGRTLIARKEYETSSAVPLRWWTGILAATLSAEFLFAFLIRSCLERSLNFYFIYFDMLAIPIGALVMVLLVTPQPISQIRIWANIIPFIVCCAAGMIVQQEWLLRVIVVLIAGYVIAMMVYVFVYGKKHDEEIKDLYSSLLGRSVRWMAIVPVLLVFLLLNYGVSVASNNPYAPIVYYALAFFIWNYVYIHIYQMVIVQETMTQPEDDVEEEDKGDNELFMAQLKQVCEDQELYTKDDLTRDELAHLMKVGHTQFTTRLKEATGLSFYDYINQLRVRKATQLIEEGKMDMWSIGQSVGYNYRSTFYRAFSAIQGCTPAEYQQKIGSN